MPNIDGDIEQYFKKFTLCMDMRPNLPLAKLVQWPESKGVFDKVHEDFLESVSGKCSSY